MAGGYAQDIPNVVTADVDCRILGIHRYVVDACVFFAIDCNAPTAG